MKQTEVKTGVLIHIDTLKNCTEMLQTPEQRAGLLETMLAAYYPNEFKASTDHWTLSSWKFLEDNIKRNDAKFEQNGEKKRKNWEEWKERNKREKEQKERELAELRNKLQLLQTTAGTSSTSVIEDNPPTVSSSVSSSTSSTTSSTTSSPSVIDNSITNKNNNSLSNKINKYTLPEVQKMLEEREIFFKKNWLFRFWNLNENTYKWKCDPISAAYAFATKYPEALKGKKGIENLPPNSAPPPDIVKKQVESITELDTARAQELWADFGKEIEKSTQIPDEFRQLYIRGRPLHAMRLGYEVRDTLWVEFDKKEDSLAFASQFYDITHKELYGYGVNGEIGRVKVQVKE